MTSNDEHDQDFYGGALVRAHSESTMSFREIIEKRVTNILQLKTPETALSRADLLFLISFLINKHESTKVEAAYKKIVSTDTFSETGKGFLLSAFLDYFDNPETMAAKFSTQTRQLKFLERSFLRKHNVDVLLTHDWPARIFHSESTQLRGTRPMGNPVAREVLEQLKPSLHCCGHMHRPYRTEVQHEAERASTQICCLSKVGFPLSVAAFEFSTEIAGEIQELNAPAWEEVLGCLNMPEEPSSDED